MKRYTQKEVDAAIMELAHAKGSQCLLDYPSDKTLEIALMCMKSAVSSGGADFIRKEFTPGKPDRRKPPPLRRARGNCSRPAYTPPRP